ncbi:tigger transposable element-derived protein 7-like [Rhopalosiphum padi]|uniref:tigger transposable element-derived protein 7-like n=1 Tax=Rhopalosiphum padi TaxID=40932 RepID=UPI00298E82EB|nr:tigger transposable element-derived protein 7-like [Rhopalosiphum padi]
MSLSKPSQGKKRKHMSLSLNDKLCVIEKLVKGASVSSICAQYGIAKQTVSDIRKKKDDIRKFVLKLNVEKESSVVKRMRLPLDQSLDDAVYKWFCQLRSTGLAVRGVEIQAAADRLAKQLNINNFKASSGWLFRFGRRHNITNKKICGESLSADNEAVEPFRKKLNDILKAENILPSQLYNYDETGLYWRALPDSTQASKADKNTPGRKISKDRVSALLCANADGSHMLKPVIVGKSKQPRAIKNIMDSLPIHYYNSKSAWFTSDITIDWFHKKAVPEIRKYQTEILKIPDNKVKALVLLDNCPAHPQVEQLTSDDKKITCMFLPANTTSLIQPMDQGVIYTAKRLYKKKLLNEILEVEEPATGEEDRRGYKTLQNLKDYNIRSMIYNFASAVSDIKHSTLINSWKKLLINEDIELDTAELETEDFLNIFHQGGENSATLEDIELWLEADECDLGYHILTEEEIVESVTAAESSETDEYDQDEADDNVNPKPKLGEIKDHLNIVIKYVEDNNNENISAYYEHLRHLRELIIKEINVKERQPKISSFFKSVSVSSVNNEGEP